MWHSAGERHKHCQALCEGLQHNCSPCKECNICVVHMVRYITTLLPWSEGGTYAMRPVAWVTESVEFSVRGYEVPSEQSEPSKTSGCSWRKLALLLMPCLITISYFVSLLPPSLSLSTLDPGPCVDLQLAQSCPPGSLDHGLQLCLHTGTIMSWKSITKLTRTEPACASLSSVHHNLPVHLLVHPSMASIHVYVQPRSITASTQICRLSQLLSQGARPITLESCLKPDWLYVYTLLDVHG